MRVLSIEDDAATAEAIRRMLCGAGIEVVATELGEEGLSLAKCYEFDLVLLDLNLPDMSGYEVLRSLRAARVATSVLILSGLAGIDDKVKGLGFGADDYMTKPFHKDELVARIHAIVRRANGHAHSRIVTDELAIDLDTKSATLAGKPVHLTRSEYAMLELLCLRKGRVVPKEAFFDHLYGGMDEPEFKIVDVFICKLRKKLADAARPLIETVWARGYMIRDLDDKRAPTAWRGRAAVAA